MRLSDRTVPAIYQCPLGKIQRECKSTPAPTFCMLQGDKKNRRTLSTIFPMHMISCTTVLPRMCCHLWLIKKNKELVEKQSSCFFVSLYFTQQLFSCKIE